ncbi:hypothetical protein AJ88_38110 [Mesorhizobium amorphae CCBAU 01583]|nr:hypothetical protein AJ88_38110 [Mesorhizobium amorphae CCBAU 01583]
MLFVFSLTLKAKKNEARPKCAGQLGDQRAATSWDGTSFAQSTLEAVVTVYPELAEMTMAIGSEVLNSPEATEDFT